MNRLFDDVDNGNNEKVVSTRRFRQRIKHAAKTFAKDYGLPQLIALQEVENLNVLDQIASEIRHRYQIRYQSILIPGQDASGINTAFLARQGVEIKNVKQLFRDKIQSPSGQPLFSRPPLYLDACYEHLCLSLLNLHLRSMRGLNGSTGADRIRRKRRAQAETIASWTNRLQRANPTISLLILGDLNALTPSDDQVDVAGIIRGNPNNERSRLPGRDLLQPDLVDLSEMIPKPKRYSFIFRQKKQQLDYMLVNRRFAADVEHIGFGRIDSRLSDHAGLIVWLM